MIHENRSPYIKEADTVNHPQHQENALEILKRVGERIKNDTKYAFQNQCTGEVAESPGKWPMKDVVLASGYNDWKYWNGVIHVGMQRASEVLDDTSYSEYVRKNYDFAFRHLDIFKKQYEAGIPDCNFHQFFRLDRLDDFGAMAAALVDIPTEINEPKEQYLEAVSAFIKSDQDRLEDGTFCRRRFGVTTLWSDDLYMSVPFLVRMYNYHGDDLWLEDAVLQSENFHRYLFNHHMGIYHHCMYTDAGQHGVAYWSRANGWVMMARITLMDFLPETHPYRDTLKDLLLTQVVGLSRYQSPSGLWHQLLDKQDSFLETSGTAMFTYGIARALNRGWIPEYYASIALKAWEGLLDYVSPAGILDGVSLGFNIRQDLPFYYHQPVEEGGAHGLGAFLLAASEISQIKKHRDCVWA